MIVSGVLSSLLHATAMAAATAVPAAPAAAAFGVEAVDVPASYPRRFNAPGAYVARVLPNGPAETAGLLPGDVVQSVAGHGVTDAASFHAAMESLTAGTGVSLGIERYGKTRTLSIVPVAADTLYASEPACDPDAVGGQLAEADTSKAHRDDVNAHAHAARALDLAEVCASVQARYDQETLLRVARAFATIGSADAARGDTATANVALANAWSVDRLIANSPGTTADGRHTAAAAAAALAHEVPGIANDVDRAIVVGLAYAGSGLGAAPFAIQNSWITNGDNYAQVLHLRVKIDLARDALLFAGGFRITVASPDVDDEAFYALDAAAPDSVRGHTPLDRAKSDIAPAEDLGRLGHAYFQRNVPATYVLTFVVTDRHADLSNAAASLAYAPQ